MLTPRLLASQVRARLKGFPAVALLGPRQCGKTTLARGLGRAYYDLEQPGERQRLDFEWEKACAGRGPLILDEAQAWPELFPRLRGEIDRRPNAKGRFVLLGSVAPALIKGISESLAGRIAHCELTPFLVGEKRGLETEKLWLHGGYPRGLSLGANAFPRWQRDYLESLVARDLPQWGLPASPPVTRRFLGMLAAVHGAPWNASDLGRSMGLSYHTVSGYLDWLEGAFLVRRLPAYHADLGKRLAKSPRVYLRDSGLLHSLLGATTLTALLGQPWVGASWEGFVIEQLLGRLAAAGRDVRASYYRSNDGLEADLLLEMDAGLWVLEIKLSTAPPPEDLRRLNKVGDLLKADRRVLVSRIAKPMGDGRQSVTHLQGAFELLGAV